MTDDLLRRDIQEKYSELRSRMSSIIQESEFSNVEIAKRLRLPLDEFLDKMKREEWTEKQIQNILLFIDNEELEDFYLGKIMNEVTKEDQWMTTDELYREMGWK